MAHALLAILGLSVLMIVHEAGHYAAARASGMRVLTFSIGFGPALVRYRRRGSPTTFQLCLVPLFAYVRVASAIGDDTVDPDDPALFENKSAWSRALMLLGGPVANYAFASAAVFALASTGLSEAVPLTPTTLATVEPGSPADVAGLRAGDVLVAVEGEAVSDIRQVTQRTAGRADVPTTYGVVRDGERFDVSIRPRDTGGRAVIGVTARHEVRTRRFTISEAGTLALALPWKITRANLVGIAELVKSRSTRGLTGPVGIAKEIATQAEQGAQAYLMALVALSAAIGCFNLLPFPFLDGGRLLFVLAEALSGRRANRTAEALVHVGGMLLLLGLAVLVTFRDILG